MESEFPGVPVCPEVRVGVCHLKETPMKSVTPGPICLIWTSVQYCCSLFDFCAIYFTTKTLFVYYCAPFIRRIKTFSQAVIKYTTIMSHNEVIELESDFGPGVRVRVF